MLDTKDFSFFETQNTFDFKGFLIKIGSYWKLFIFSLLISFTIAYQVNIRKQKIYEINTVLSLKEENNPFFTANTSLVFNWGGTSDQVQNVIMMLKSRTHTEAVVDRMQYYIEYLKQGKYYEIDIYGEVPFTIKLDKTAGNIINKNIKVKFINSNEYSIDININEGSNTVFNYSKNTVQTTTINDKKCFKRFRINQNVSLPYLNWQLNLKPFPQNYIGEEFIIRLNDFDGTVSKYRALKVSNDEKSGSIITLGLEGTNKARMVDYLNSTVNVLIKRELEKKNLFATNTIKFIDSTLIETEKQLRATNDDLEYFQRGKNILQIEDNGTAYSVELQKFDSEKDDIERQIIYLKSLKSYLKNNTDFSTLPAPSVAGIKDPNIVVNVSKLISLSIERSQMAYSVKNGKIFEDFDNEMTAIKNVLIENINAVRNSLNYDLNLVNSKINVAEGNINKLPQEKQELSKIQRKYSLSEDIYSNFLAKKSEAEVVKAANLSDIHFLDSAKDIGGGLIGPKTAANYIIALLAGFLIPLIFIFIIFFINNSVQNSDDINRLTQIPLIGVIGKKTMKSNLAVFEKPKSALSESFRAIRSSLQFIYKKNHIEGTKTLMLTSTVSGEGKSFCSINIATVFALSEKKTVILGLDLRKPKIFEDFNVKNDIGAVNYLIGQKNIDEIIQKTQIPYLDLITSGPIPPNPSELIMSEAMATLMTDLKSRYDYIILDTPPVGLVADALELAQYCDVTLYIIRQNFTKKDMITLLNNREKRGELNNISIVFNGFENKAKYGYSYGYGFDYGYGTTYSNGYHDDEEPKNIFVKYYKKLFKK